METEKSLCEGMSPDEARRAPLVAFGGVERTEETTMSLGMPRPIVNEAFAPRRFRTVPQRATLSVSAGDPSMATTAVREQAWPPEHRSHTGENGLRPWSPCRSPSGPQPQGHSGEWILFPGGMVIQH
jgi:hypothetical protein